MELLIIDPASIPASLDGYRWIYAGSDEGVTSAEKMLTRAGALPAFSAGEFEEIVHRENGPFLLWMNEMQMKYGHAADFWHRDEYSGCPTSSSIFKEICYLTAVSSALEINCRGIVLVCTYGGLARATQELAKKKGIICTQGCNNTVLWDDCKSFFGYLYFVGLSLFSYVMARLFFPRRKTLKKVDVLAEFWIAPHMLVGGNLNDRYLNRALQFLDNHGYVVALYPNLGLPSPLSIVRTFAGLRRLRRPVAIMERLITFTDLVDALSLPFTRSRVSSILPYGIMDITAIIRRNERRRRYFWDSTTARMRYLAAKRIGEHGWQPALLLAWDENQLVSKGGYKGVRDFLPGTEIAGVRNNLPFSFWFAMMPTVAHWQHSAAPHRYIVCGRLTKEYLNHFVPAVPVDVAFAERYSALFSALRGGLEMVNAGGGKSIVLMLPTFMNHAVRIISILAEGGHGYEVLVKPHPDMNIEILRGKLASLQVDVSSLRFVSDDNATLFRRAVVVVSWQSSSMLEAICFGVPVIEICQPYGINYSPLNQMSKDMWRQVYNSDGLKEGLAWAIHHPLSLAERKLRGLELAGIIAEESERTFDCYRPSGHPGKIQNAFHV